MANETTFEQDLFSSIGELGLWDEENSRVTNDGIVFSMEEISGIEKFRAVGQLSIEDRGEDRAVDFMNMNLVLAKGVDENKIDAIIPKLYEINITFKTGVFFLDGGGNLCFESTFPIIREDVESSLQIFTSIYSDVVDFINTVYPYLLRVFVKPEDANFADYIEALLTEPNE